MTRTSRRIRVARIAALTLALTVCMGSAQIAVAGGGKLKKHAVNLTTVLTTDATLTTSQGTISGKPFGSGTGVHTATQGGTATDFVWTFSKGTVKGFQDSTTGPSAARITKGTGKYKRLKPTTVTVTNESVSGLTVTNRVTGSVKY